MSLFIRLQSVEKTYGSSHVLRGIDLDIVTGERIAIRGASGSGKSTLLYLLGALERPTKGRVEINGKNLVEQNDEALAQFRNSSVGFVFQFHFLLPSLTAWGNILLPARIGGHDVAIVEKRALNLAQRLGVATLLDKWPHQLSGGEQQRVAVARALINNPRIVFADEPTGNLDSGNARDLHHLFMRLRDEFKQTFLIVTHNEELAGMSDRILHMKDGRMLDS